MNADNLIIEGSNAYPDNYNDLITLINHYAGTCLSKLSIISLTIIKT